MNFHDWQEDEFEANEFGAVKGVALHYWDDINDLAMKDGWLKSNITYI